MKLVIASSNLHKIREFRNILKPFSHIEVLSLHQFPDYVALPEEGKTFQETALCKAEHAAKHLNQWILADDSGLVVPALNYEPGIYSQRYAGPNATDAENRKKLLKRMEGLKDLERSAYFECCLAIANYEGIKKHATGLCEGYILREERGRHGFGYDPIFVKQDYEKTFAELDESIKNRISHRRKAFERLSTFLETLHD
jgi:XTP/dITP diphosphohydrolase